AAVHECERGAPCGADDRHQSHAEPARADHEELKRHGRALRARYEPEDIPRTRGRRTWRGGVERAAPAAPRRGGAIGGSTIEWRREPARLSAQGQTCDLPL